MRKIEENLRANPALKAELEAFLKKAEAEIAESAKQLERMKAEQEAHQRRFDAMRIVKEARDHQYVNPSDTLVDAVALALGELPVEVLDDDALAQLKHHHLAQLVVKKIVAYHGRPLRVDAEILFARRFQTVLADEHKKRNYDNDK
jgi:hypothetical protein